ncbi:MAG: bile acid:sodium symporter family protein [Candidatus Methanosuratincola sp.]|jgi:BASS family bile acid:Na+ symporter
MVKALRLVNKAVTGCFALWMLLFALFAFLVPSSLSRLTHVIPPLLGVVMFGMGATLTGEDLRRVIARPVDVAVGTVAQYTFMPLIGYAVSSVLGLPPPLAVGVVLVGACPGGTASNVVTYLARGDLALSVTLTALSTFLAPILTPLLTYLLGGEWVSVPVKGLFASTAEVVLLPVSLGLGLRRILNGKAELLAEAAPLVSALGIVFIVGVIVAANAGSIGASGPTLALAVVLHNALGFAAGFLVARALGMESTKVRAVSIEVGMQNSGLAVALASAHFGALAALPGAVFSIWHNVAGSLLAWWWRRRA